MRLSAAAERRYAKHASDHAYRLLSGSGEIVAARNDAVLDRLAIDTSPAFGFQEKTVVGARFVIGVRRVQVDGAPATIVTAVRADSNGLFWAVLTNEAVHHIVLPVTPMLILMLWTVAWTVQWGLRSLRSAANAAAEIDPRRLDLRLPVAGHPAEVAQLVEAVNAALAKVEEAFAAQRRFTAAAAHELRTPLAVLTLELDRLGGSVGPHLRADVDAMTRIVNQLLAAARLDLEDQAAREPVDLGAIGRSVVARLVPLALDAGRAIDFEDRGAATLVGNAAMLADALRNLIDNALQHAPPGSTVLVTAGPGSVLMVEDGGPGVPFKDRALIFEPFWRSPRSSYAGAGLGLALVRDIAERHRGTVAVGVSDFGGASFTMTFADDDLAADGTQGHPGLPAREPAALTA